MMKCKHDICLNKKINTPTIRKCWLKRKTITQSLNKGIYYNITIVRYSESESVSHIE